MSSYDKRFFYYLVLGSTGLSGETRCRLQDPGKDPQIHDLLLTEKQNTNVIQSAFNLKRKFVVSVTRFSLEYELRKI